MSFQVRCVAHCALRKNLYDQCLDNISVKCLWQLVKKANARDVVDRIPETIQPAMEEWFVEVIVLGLRNLAPYQLTPIMNPFLEFDCGDKARSTDFRATKPSKIPSGQDPNFLERVVLPVKLPRDPLFAPSLNITVKD
ncbi:MAG: hypothetical protein ACK56I_07365, partial [bacterium]